MLTARLPVAVGILALSGAAWSGLLARDGRRDRPHQHLLNEESNSEESNGSTVHLTGEAPVAINVSVYMHIVSAAPEDIADPTLWRQLDVLNEDYAPSGIHFHLDGITRTEHMRWSRNEDRLAMHKALRMGNYSTLNLFYIDTFFHNADNLATTTYPDAYAPGSDDFFVDGCVLHAGTLPGGVFAPYNFGRTTTHEVGHWLGLYHTFEGFDCAGEGDRVDDTPAQAVAATKGCGGRQDSCPGLAGLDDVTNFMDYGDDACMEGFTAGQARRMHGLWDKYRA